MTPQAIIKANGLSKSFFGNPVLQNVSIALEPGRIHALLGENGAGKSTLINLLSGALAPDGGEIEIDGRSHRRLTPSEARRAGIAVVQQELSLTSDLSIAENIGLGAYPRRFGLIDYKALARKAREVCDLVGLEENLSTPVGDLPLGRRQMVEIAKALFRKPRILVLDEPTSSLSAHEAQTLTRLLQRLRAEGTAILYISHRLNEVMRLCEHVTVLKDGKVTADRSLQGVDAAGLVRLMVGRDPGDLFPHWTPSPERQTIVEVTGFSSGLLRDIDLEIKRGEILGLGGLVGQGQEDLLLGLYGALPASARRAVFNNVAGLPSSVSRANALGLAYVPADRKREGLHLIHSIAWNMMLPDFGKARGLSRRDPAAERKLATELADRLSIKGDLTRQVQALSGGNQQKVALAKWMPADPPILLLNDPTRGVDVETKREIYVLLRRFAAQGKAIVLSSSDTPELVHLCDRVAVMREGGIAALLEREKISEEAIVAAAMGAEAAKVAA
ncbi:sugar ABC transporter ATP-binding protein [Taklimakanibacter albus]|uniref:Sugar ABC transporter ATP-binding protein n=1 Tax=Taklimakanibacter albus TaxID=2800327 RepID=A0ACC5RAZ1_9HYPH|nr:sugar ABC transporter ATP-binding protein [Aestuariivirga sp. YIM B02566]MBK1869812.1 sugar ABC transporter ATP-binding protein [Aestuariivirga sp. YIM B02566]